MRIVTLFCLFLLAATASWGQSTQPTVYTVTTALDGFAAGATLGEGTCDDVDPGTTGVQCSLRQAIAEANATSGAVIVNVPGQLAGGASGTYTLNESTSPAIDTYEDANRYGDLDIGGASASFSSLTIRGTGTPGPTVTQSTGALGGDRLFHVLDGTTATVRFERLNLTGGQARPGRNGNSDGSGIGVDGEDGPDGGAILIGSGATNVTIDQVTFAGNATQSGGNGAVPATSIMRTEGGAAGDGGDGGALYISSGAVVTVLRSTFSGNGTGDAGGAASGQANSGSNPARGGNGGDGGNGGAIYNAGTLTIQETTIADNTLGDPGQGAGGVNGGDNGFTGQGGSGGGIANAQRPETETTGLTSEPAAVNEGTATLRNTIVASNTAGDDPTDGPETNDPDKQPGSDLYDASSGGTFTTEGYNLIGTNNSVATAFPASTNETTYNANNDLVGTGQQADASRINPDLGSLNGNSDEAVPTRPLLAASPAVDRGVNTRIDGSDVPLDARGFLRPDTTSSGARVDIGSYERNSKDALVNLVVNEFDAVNPGDNAEFVEIKNNGSFPTQLADVVLVLYDRDDTACYSVNLRGELAAGDVYTIGDSGVSPDQTFDQGFAYEDCPPPTASNGDSDETAVDANVLDDQTGAVALYTGKATDYPNGAQAGQNTGSRQDVVIYDNTATTSGSGGSSLMASLQASSVRSMMDGSSLCGAFGQAAGCAASGDTDDTSLSRDEDGSFSAGAPSPGTDNPSASSTNEVCFVVASNAGPANDDEFYRLDIETSTSPSTVTQTLINSDVGPSSGSDIEALALSPGDDTLFAISQGTFGRLDRNTGNFTTIGDVGTGEGEYGMLTFDDIDALAFDPSTGTLYGALRRDSTAGSPDVLFQINPQTGSLIPNAFSVDANNDGSFDDYVPLGDDNMTLTNADATDFDAFLFMPSGQMFGVFNDAADGGFIAEVNKNTGAATNAQALGTTNIEAATFSSVGDAYGTTGTSGSDNNSIFELNTSTGSTTELTYADGGSDLEATDYESITCEQTSTKNNPQQADLELTKSADPEIVPAPGSTVEFTVTVSNNESGAPNPVTATGVEFTDQLPDGFTFVSTSNPEGSCTNNAGTVTCSVAGIPPGESVPVTITATAGSNGAYTNFAQITASDQPDPDSTPDNNTSGTPSEDDEALASGSVLPVELTAFDVMLDGDVVRLAWTTASETNNAGFSVERSIEQDQWSEITFVAGAGTTLETQTYRTADAGAAQFAEVVRYRLRQVDLDGSHAYGPIVEVTLGAPSEDAITGVFPNPMTDRADVRLALATSGTVRVALYDVMGREVAVLHDGYAESGRVRMVLSSDRLAAGTYFLHATTETSRLTQRVTITR
jgi:uncharacterized repeat protein (TIGR01451 family)